MWKSSNRAWRSGRSYHHEPGRIKGRAKDTEIIGNAMPVLDVTLNRGKRIGVAARGNRARSGSRTAGPAVVPAPRHCHCGGCVNRRGGNYGVGTGRAGHRAWRHNRDEHPVVAELLAHRDRVLDTGSDGTPSGGAPSGGAPSGGAPERRNPRQRPPQRRYRLLLRHRSWWYGTTTRRWRSLCRLPITQTTLRWVACIGPLRSRGRPRWSTTTTPTISP